MNEENPVRAERSGSPKRYLNLVHLKLPVHELKLSRELAVYIGRAASIYRTCRIYISDMQYLYIQYHRYIDARRGKMKEKRSAFPIQIIERRLRKFLVIRHSSCQSRGSCSVRKPENQSFLLLQEVRSLLART